MPYTGPDPALVGPRFEADYAPADRALVAEMLERNRYTDGFKGRVRDRADAYVAAIRGAPKGAGLEDFMQEYSLSTKEGLALMVLAEALLRVPDPATQDRLIEDKLGSGEWAGPDGDEGWLLMAASWGIGLSARVVRPGETPGHVLKGLVRRVGVPVVRAGTKRAMQVMGHNFVLGQTIGDAMSRAAKGEAKGLRYSYDMLGEGARTYADAARYDAAYAGAIERIGQEAKGTHPARPGISVKLSALHPRYLLKNRADVMGKLVPRVTDLALAAKAHDLGFTVDAEEADRLELSLDVFAAVASDERRRGASVASRSSRARPRRTSATSTARGSSCGRGTVCTRSSRRTTRSPSRPSWSSAGPKATSSSACTAWAGHRDLLAYLVRRLLENAANSSFVAQVADEDVTDDELLTHPQDILRPLIERGEDALHPRIRLPGDLYPGRRNSRGAELGHQPDLTALLSAVRRFEGGGLPVQSLVPGSDAGASGERRDSLNPATGEPVCDWVVASDAAVEAAVGRAREAFPAWNAAGPHARAQLLRRYADVLELHRSRLIGVLVAEAGKTVDDALLEVREAVDFCRYYAGEAERIMLPQALPGPVGETNTYMLEGRGVFACIAPWNFPLAIFLGQAVAALAAGNTVVAKPAEQTPLTASVAVGLMKEAGFPEGVLCTVLGGGAVGAKLISDPRLAGVAFTGSTGTAKAIGRTLAEGDGPILPFIAETGGINAMVVDSTALPEQVADDVVASAFRSAGQRCSALRVLYLQDDVADRMIEMIVGAAKALSVGDPSDPDTDLGPVIDEAARERLERHWAEVSSRGTVLYEGGPLPKEGIFFSPRIVEMDAFDAVREEAFGPILHVVRYGSEELEEVMASIAGTGYGLTFGLHSRLDFRAEALTSSAPAGNVYVNRSMTGAVVGVQPFGGRGLSGTGPKAGGPLYLTRFCEERTVTVNTAAAGGNASLIALSED